MSFRYKAGFIQEFFDPLTVGPSDTIWSWGENGYGQLGQNIAYSALRSSPVQIGSSSSWVNSRSGLYFVLATKSDGTLWSWGQNNSGQLGQNISYAALRSSPVQVGSLTTWNKVSCGAGLSAAIKNNSTLWAWGANANGQLGQNNVVDRSSPVQVGSLADWNIVACGTQHMVMIKSDYTLWACGSNSNGQLGINSIVNKSSPIQVGSETNWLNAYCGNFFVAATKSDGTLWTWGQNNYGQLGSGTVLNRSSPVQVGPLTNWNSVFGCTTTCFSIKTDGTLWGWGRGSEGQLGNSNIINRSSPVQIGNLTNWAIGSPGPGQTTTVAAIKTDGTLWAWGDNGSGQLGVNDRVSRSSPVQVGSLTNWTNVSVGAAWTIATQRGY